MPGSVPFTLRTLAWLLRRSLVAAFDDGCFSIAKGAAYSALLSFFPVLTSAAAILVQTRAQFVSSTLERFLSVVVPPKTWWSGSFGSAERARPRCWWWLG